MKDFFEKLIDDANAKINLKREAEQRKADDVARVKAEGQKLADAYGEKSQPMFAAAVAAMRGRGILASCERKTSGVLVVIDALETDAALKPLASSFEYSYFHGGIHVNEVVCGGVAIARTLPYSDLENAFVGWMTAAMEARGSRPARPRS
jgi:hypothetical protein